MDEPAPGRLTHRGVPVDRELRILALGQLANRFGSGAVMTTSAVYFTRVVGLTAAQVALAMAVSTAIGLSGQLPAGRLADTRGPRGVLVILLGLLAVASALPALAQTVTGLVAALSVWNVAGTASMAVQQGVIAQIARGGRGVLFKAYLRAVTNVGIALGSLAGGAALLIDRPSGYVAVFLLDAVVTGFAAVVTYRLPALPAVPHQVGEPLFPALRDGPFVAITVLLGLFTLHFTVMELGIALYLTQRTHLPRVMIAVLLLLNTVAVALFQVRLSRRSDSVTTAAGSLLRGGVWIAGGFVLIGLVARTDTWLPGAAGVAMGIALLVLGAGAHVIGEMISSGGQWGVQMGLAPHERQGQYQALAGMGWAIPGIAGPPLVAALCVGLGEVGWYILAGSVAAVAAAGVPAARWALATRARYGVTTHSG